MRFADACTVTRAEAEDVGGAFVQASDSMVVVSLSHLARGVGVLIGALVLQLVAHQLPHHILGGLPLEQCCVAHGGTNHHTGFAWHWLK